MVLAVGVDAEVVAAIPGVDAGVVAVILAVDAGVMAVTLGVDARVLVVSHGCRCQGCLRIVSSLSGIPVSFILGLLFPCPTVRG